jgi:hypothetical protein
MHDDATQNGERFFPPEDMVNASELREFLFCERAWFLSRQGYRISAQAESQRSAGIVFHEERSAAANRGRRPWVFWWAVIFAGAGIAILLVELWKGSR